jgi:uncharacterized protein (TIGR02588 family)
VARKVAKNRLEWSVFAVGLVLVLGTLGFLVRESLVAAGGTPDVVARLGLPKASSGGFMVPVEVSNVGNGTAEDVKVTVVLELPDAEPEEAELDIAFLPRDSRRDGWVTFQNDPGRGSLRLGPIAFEVP